MAFGTTINAGELTDRIRLERFTTDWALDSVVSAKVAPGAAPGVPGPDPAAVALEHGNAHAITVRYRSDLTRGMRVRWGSETLIVYAVSDLDGRRLWSLLGAESFLAYATRHDALLGRVAIGGAAITFTKPTTSSNTPATYDSNSDTPAAPPNETTVSGMAVEDSAEQTYAPSSQVQTATRTLLFVPTTYGELPEPGATCTWAGDGATIVSVDPIAPNGVPIGARVVIGR